MLHRNPPTTQIRDDSLLDLLEVAHFCRCHGRPVKLYAGEAALLRAVVVRHEYLFARKITTMRAVRSSSQYYHTVNGKNTEG